MDYTNEQIEKALARLPLEFQEAIATSAISKKVIDIGKRYNLHFDQIEKLKNNVMLLALGFADSNSFSGLIAKELSLPFPQAQTIVADINKEIFEEIRKTIKEKTTEIEQVEETGDTQVKAEETLDRDELLKAIENPEQIGSIKNQVLSIKEKDELVAPTPSGRGSDYNVGIDRELGVSGEKPVLGIAEQKMSGSFKMENFQTIETDKSIAAIKKTDPYREAIV